MDYSEKLRELMDSLNLKKVENKDRVRVLLVNGNLKCDYSSCFRYFADDNYNIKEAYMTLLNDAEFINVYRENTEKVYSTKVFYKDFDNENNSHEMSINGYWWKSDIEDSGVVIDDKVVKGTIDQLRKFHSLANNHNRYIRASYMYMNETVVRIMDVCRRYDLYKPYDSFMEYYNGGIVD